MLTLSEAFQNWQDWVDESGGIDRTDGSAMADSWNTYIDVLRDDGDVTELQYHYCPAWDEAMPTREGELDFILQAMGVRFSFSPIGARSPATGMFAGSRHFTCTLTRGANSHAFQYSMGPALTGDPTLVDVLDRLLADAEHAAEYYEDWCDLVGFATDSPRAARVYKACRKTAEQLAELFHADELRDLRDLYDLRELYEIR